MIRLREKQPDTAKNDENPPTTRCCGQKRTGYIERLILPAFRGEKQEKYTLLLKMEKTMENVCLKGIGQQT